MRLAFITDIHGNPLALDAVLSQIEADGGVDGYWFLGDYCAIGYDPVTVLERITSLPNAVHIRGNTDRFLYAGDLPDPTQAEALNDPHILAILADVHRSFAWSQGYLAATRWLDWLEALPLDVRLTLPDGTRLLAVHAAPGEDDGIGVRPSLKPAELDTMLAQADADLLVVGHTHTPQDYRVNGGRIVNPGSVGNPFPPDLRAAYAILDADAAGHTIELKRAAYDHDAVIEQLRKSRHPVPEYIINFYQGKHTPPWEK